MKTVKAWAFVHKDKPTRIEFTKPHPSWMNEVVRVEIREVGRDGKPAGKSQTSPVGGDIKSLSPNSNRDTDAQPSGETQQNEN